MGTFDDFEDLFRGLGMSEAAAKAAAVGRYRSEADARAADAEDEALDLADRMAEEALTRPSTLSRDLAELQGRLDASIPIITENVMRSLRGLPPKPMPGASPAVMALPSAAEGVVSTVREVLRMTESDAQAFVDRLYQRETRRGGAEHADRFVRTFAEGLRDRVAVREVAPR